MGKVLLNEGREQAANFQRSVLDVMSRANELIAQWHQFQDFHTVKTYDDFLSLIEDPVAMMDRLLISLVDIKIAGGKTKINAASLAPMLGIDYESWLNLVAGKPIKLDCEPCRKTKIRKGQSVISLQEFRQYEKYITFQNGRFVDNKTVMEEHQMSFQVFAETPAQKATFDHWAKLAEVLNEHKRRGHLGAAAMKTIADLTGLKYVYDTGELYIDEQKVLIETLK